MKVLFTPRDDNPYQRELAEELATLGVQVDYLRERTHSHSLNVLLMPLEVMLARAKGYRVLHVHWVYRFAVPGSGRSPLLRRLARVWFGLFLTVVKLAGLRVVWTAHNVLPHTQVFDDDEAGRRRLLRETDAVIVHSDATREPLRAIGPLPHLVATVPQGTVAEAAIGVGDRRQDLGVPATSRCVGMVGRLEAYKGVRELTEVFIDLPGVGLRLLLAGRCSDLELRSWLETRAASDPRIALDLRRVPDAEFGSTLRSLDVCVLPFRSITNSSSAVAALAAGVPVLLPDDGSLGDLPLGAVHRYSSLAEGLAWSRDVPAPELESMSMSARNAGTAWTWEDAALATLRVYDEVTSVGVRPSRRMTAVRRADGEIAS